MLFIIVTGALHWHHTYHWMDEALTSEYVFQDTVDTDYPKYTNDKSDDVILNKKFDSIISVKQHI